MTVSPRRIAAKIDELLDRTNGSICPSDVARALGPEDGWRELMPAVREVAHRRAAAGELRVTQRGEDVDALTARGPIRISRRR